MDFDDIEALRLRSPAWKLLRARNAPLVLSFLGGWFVEANRGATPATQLAAALDDHLYALNKVRAEDEQFRGSPAAYLEDWSDPESGWLRRFYPRGSEEVHYDATPAVERACSWLAGLASRAFVGTESRLHTIVELLRQITHGAEADPQVRLVELHRRRDEIEREIANVEQGRVSVLDGSALRDRYQLFAGTARELLSDFRQVEENFRNLDRGARERIAAWQGSKGELLEGLVGDRTDISASDQGRSFQAFYDFLLSQTRQEELTRLLDKVQSLRLPDADRRLRTVHHDWFDAAERTQQTVRQLSEQLRRFLDDQVWLENRRVLDLIRSIEAHALALRDAAPSVGLDVDVPGVDISMPFDRPLYEARASSELDGTVTEAVAEELDTSALFAQSFVDQARLAENIRSVVPRRSSALLTDILDLYPLSEGVAELIGYLALSDEDVEVVLDEDDRIRIEVSEDDDRRRGVLLPLVTVHRR